MTQAAEDPRDRFRHLPEPVRSEDLVETRDADPHIVVETGSDTDRLLRLAGGGTP
jgi:hypothetical protein